MICALCGTIDSTHFGMSNLLCDYCLFKKQIKLDAHISKLKMQQLIDDTIIHGQSPISSINLFGFPIVEVPDSVPNCKCALDYDDKNPPVTAPNTSWSTSDADHDHQITQMMMLAKLLRFEQEMTRPIHINPVSVTILCDREFDSTAPLLENYIP